MYLSFPAPLFKLESELVSANSRPHVRFLDMGGGPRRAASFPTLSQTWGAKFALRKRATALRRNQIEGNRLLAFRFVYGPPLLSRRQQNGKRAGGAVKVCPHTYCLD